MSYNPKARASPRYCLIPFHWTPTKIEARSCSDRSHIHLTRRQVYELENDGVIEWLHTPRCRHEKGLVRLRLHLTKVRDLSCRVGEALALAVERGEMWAKTMVDEIIGRHYY